MSVAPVLPAAGEPGTGAGFLLLRRSGALWGLADDAVLGLARRGGSYRITTAGGELAADEVLGVVAALEVRPLAPLLGRYWPEAAAGLAVFGGVGGRPLVVLDPRHPPRALRAPAAGAGAGQGAAEGEGDGEPG